MAETFAALLLAHVFADFVLQTNAMAEEKALRQPRPFILHLLVVGLTAAIVLRPQDLQSGMVLCGLILVHGAIDLVKTRAASDRVWPFLADQAAHLATLLLVAFFFPGLWASGFGTNHIPGWIPAFATLISGAILATRTGAFVVGLFMRPWEGRGPAGLPSGGKYIGHLERGLIFLLVLAGTAEGIGFLIAAKSVLRFGAVKDEAELSEYVIIGTLASFGWAFAVTLFTLAILSFLPPLGIPDLSP